MKRITILFGASLMILLSGLSAEIHGQGQACCPDGYMSEQYYIMVNGTCQLSGYTCDYRSNQCDPFSCNTSDRDYCLQKGDFWYDEPNCYCETNYCSSYFANDCTYNQGRYWDSFSCTCGECNPNWANCGSWTLNPNTCGCDPPPPDPCASAYGIQTESCVYFHGMCTGCGEAISGGYSCSVYLTYIGSDYSTCATQYLYSYSDGGYTYQDCSCTDGCYYGCACW